MAQTIIKRPIILDLNQRNDIFDGTWLTLSVGDQNINYLEVTITENSVNKDLSAFANKIQFLCTPARSTELIESTAIEPTDLAHGKFNFKIPKAVTNMSGMITNAVFRLMDTNANLVASTSNFSIQVKPTIGVDELLGGSIDSIQDGIAYVQSTAKAFNDYLSQAKSALDKFKSDKTAEITTYLTEEQTKFNVKIKELEAEGKRIVDELTSLKADKTKQLDDMIELYKSKLDKLLADGQKSIDEKIIAIQAQFDEFKAGLTTKIQGLTDKATQIDTQLKDVEQHVTELKASISTIDFTKFLKTDDLANSIGAVGATDLVTNNTKFTVWNADGATHETLEDGTGVVYTVTEDHKWANFEIYSDTFDQIKSGDVVTMVVEAKIEMANTPQLTNDMLDSADFQNGFLQGTKGTDFSKFYATFKVTKDFASSGSHVFTLFQLMQGKLSFKSAHIYKGAFDPSLTDAFGNLVGKVDSKLESINQYAFSLNKLLEANSTKIDTLDTGLKKTNSNMNVVTQRIGIVPENQNLVDMIANAGFKPTKYDINGDLYSVTDDTTTGTRKLVSTSLKKGTKIYVNESLNPVATPFSDKVTEKVTLTGVKSDFSNINGITIKMSAALGGASSLIYQKDLLYNWNGGTAPYSPSIGVKYDKVIYFTTAELKNKTSKKIDLQNSVYFYAFSTSTPVINTIPASFKITPIDYQTLEIERVGVAQNAQYDYTLLTPKITSVEVN